MSAVKKNQPKQGYPPDLVKYVAKKMRLKINGGRMIEGTVIGVDGFMNIVVDKAIEIKGN